MSDTPQGASTPPAVPSYSRGGLIGAAVMTVMSLLTIAVSPGGSKGSLVFSYFFANAALFWRAFRPPLSFGQGFVTWLGGMIAGLAVSALGVGPWYIQTVLFLAFLLFGGVFLWAGRPKKPKTQTQP